VIKRTDELFSLGNHAGQVVEELTRMNEDFSYVERFVGELKILARDFKKPPPDRGFIRLNANVKPDDPVEELEVFDRYLKLTIANLDRAAELLRQRRGAIAELLS
jgi:hypothetical protein